MLADPPAPLDPDELVQLNMLPDRLRSRIVVDPSGCWLWTGSKTGDGYGYCEVLGRRDGVYRKRTKAHRAVYEAAVGPIPEGLVLDHLCRVTLCVRPVHLDPVTQKVNLARSAANGGALYTSPPRPTECIRGHRFTPENTRIVRNGACAGVQICRTCDRERMRARRAGEVYV